MNSYLKFISSDLFNLKNISSSNPYSTNSESLLVKYYTNQCYAILSSNLIQFIKTIILVQIMRCLVIKSFHVISYYFLLVIHFLLNISHNYYILK